MTTNTASTARRITPALVALAVVALCLAAVALHTDPAAVVTTVAHVLSTVAVAVFDFFAALPAVLVGWFAAVAHTVVTFVSSL